MDKEKLEREAYEYFKSICDDYNEELERTGKRHHWVGFDIENAYIASAELREKRIEELEVTNKKISDECHKLVDTLEKKQKENELLETQNIKLQAEVSRLTIKNADIIGKIAFTENALNNTKAQIEKMKCCEMCKHKNLNWNFSPICEARDKIKIENPLTCKCDKWEIKE